MSAFCNQDMDVSSEDGDCWGTYQISITNSSQSDKRISKIWMSQKKKVELINIRWYDHLFKTLLCHYTVHKMNEMKYCSQYEYNIIKLTLPVK